MRRTSADAHRRPECPVAAARSGAPLYDLVTVREVVTTLEADALPTHAGWHARVVVTLFAFALFMSAFLLFSLEPMVAKVLLPKLGGTPMVWNTCMVFFQGTLLAGYGAAHVGAGRYARRARWLYPALLVGAALSLPLTFTRVPDVAQPPAGWLLLELMRVTALPVLALSMSAPALQAWFSRTRFPGARDPYFLYAASNAGSLVALLAYPTIIEPRIGLGPQMSWWAAGYLALVAVACTCLELTRRDVRPVLPSEPSFQRSIDGWQRVRWIALAFVPSSLMIGVTTYISTDVAAVPLIWVLPLALYLVTFVIAFGRFSLPMMTAAERRVPFLAIAIAFMLAANNELPMQLHIPIHLAMFTAVALMCHGRLASERPPPHRLTEFYLLLSIGGMAGGVFNALLAPVIFNSVVEYPIVLVCACAVPLLRANGLAMSLPTRDVAYAVGTAAIVAVAKVALGDSLGGRGFVILLGVIAIITFSQARRPLRFSLMVGAILMASPLARSAYGTVLYAERTFFGSYHVGTDVTGQFRALYHGTTLHGLQALASDRHGEPLTYYHRSGPFGQAFERLPRLRNASDVAVVGLGIGSLAAYATERQRWTFFEIDPAVERIARNQRYFSLLGACGSRCRVVLGDARLSLVRSDTRFDVIVLDAFSSDAIPMHLMTREAFDVYLRHLKPGGILMFHISNRYLALGDVLGRLASDRRLTAFEQVQTVSAKAGNELASSDWVVASADADALAPLAADARWKILSPRTGTPLWTDDFSNILTALRYGRN